MISVWVAVCWWAVWLMAPAAGQCCSLSTAQSTAASQLRTALGLSSCWSGALCSGWRGVVCSGVNVVEIDVSLCRTAVGNASASSLAAFAALRKLVLSDNPGATGELQLLQLPSTVTELGLSFTSMSGTLPADWVYSLDRLRTLNLNGLRAVIGSLPSEWGQGRWTLTSLSLRGANISGSLPEDWAEFSSLLSLDLSGTGVSGTLPASWGSGALGGKLRSLFLSRTGVAGTVPPSWAFGPQLFTVELAECNVSGSIPAAWFSRNYDNLATVNASWCALSGELPSAISSAVTTLDVSHNLMSGALPDISSSLLTIFDASWNHFSGGAPAALPSTLRRLDVSHNWLSGPLDFRWVAGASLAAVDVSFNNFSGNIVSMFRSSNNSQWVLNVAANSLSGSLPALLFSLVGALNASHNAFVLPLPTTIGPTSIGTLDISHNAFVGPLNVFPAPLTLTTLYASNNNITAVGLSFGGTALVDADFSWNIVTAVPSALPATLQVLLLSHNRLQLFPAVCVGCSSLSVLDLSGNPTLSGTLPDEFAPSAGSLRVLRVDGTGMYGAFPLPWCRSVRLNPLAVDATGCLVTYANGTVTRIISVRDAKEWIGGWCVSLSPSEVASSSVTTTVSATAAKSATPSPSESVSSQTSRTSSRSESASGGGGTPTESATPPKTATPEAQRTASRSTRTLGTLSESYESGSVQSGTLAESGTPSRSGTLQAQSPLASRTHFAIATSSASRSRMPGDIVGLSPSLTHLALPLAASPTTSQSPSASPVVSLSGTLLLQTTASSISASCSLSEPSESAATTDSVAPSLHTASDTQTASGSHTAGSGTDTATQGTASLTSRTKSTTPCLGLWILSITPTSLPLHVAFQATYVDVVVTWSASVRSLRLQLPLQVSWGDATLTLAATTTHRNNTTIRWHCPQRVDSFSSPVDVTFSFLPEWSSGPEALGQRDCVAPVSNATLSLSASPPVIPVVLQDIAGVAAVAGAAAGAAQQSMLQLSLSRCEFSDTQEVSIAESPTRLRFGPTAGSAFRGAVVGNVALFVGVCGAATLGSVLHHRVRRTPTLLESLAALGLPGRLYIALSVILQPTVSASVALFLLADASAGDYVLGVFGIVFVVAVAVRFARRLHQIVEGLMTVPRFAVDGFDRLVGRWLDWVPVTANSAGAEHSTFEDEDATTRKIRFGLLALRYDTLLGRKKAGRDWFLWIEIAVSVAYGAIGGTRPKGSQGCMEAQVALCVTASANLLALVAFRPYASRNDGVVKSVFAAGAVLSCALMLASAQDASDFVSFVQLCVMAAHSSLVLINTLRLHRQRLLDVLRSSSRFNSEKSFTVDGMDKSPDLDDPPAECADDWSVFLLSNEEMTALLQEAAGLTTENATRGSPIDSPAGEQTQGDTECAMESAHSFVETPFDSLEQKERRSVSDDLTAHRLLEFICQDRAARTFGGPSSAACDVVTVSSGPIQQRRRLQRTVVAAITFSHRH